ncbi:MAG TPA: PEP/pyruvate-binding domain-containing protein [Terriglobales bacterium]|nr:PEP/pyruvate-binding domain-containing protein [Terriglobales bacterium]
MNHQPQLDAMLRDLQERAKELKCLYRVDAVLKHDTQPLSGLLQQLVAILPEAWQFPEACAAQITLEDQVVSSTGFAPSEWMQSAKIVVQGQAVGTVEIAYSRALPPADEGPFLAEERKLVETVAERIAAHVAQRRLTDALHGMAAQRAGVPGESRLLLDLLRGTDPGLLQRISRKLVHHLSWNGVQAARDLLQRGLPHPAAEIDENQPLRQPPPAGAADVTVEAFRMAEEHMSEPELLALVTTWMKEEKAGFLVQALGSHDSTLAMILEAIERFRHSGMAEGELSPATLRGLRVALLRRIFSDQRDFVEVGREFIGVADTYELVRKIIAPPRSYGRLGGKSSGLFLAKKVLEKSPLAGPLLRQIRVPNAWYIASDAILHFVRHNELDGVLNWKYMDIAHIRQEYPHLVSLFKKSAFPPDLARGLALALDDLGERPLIVRSSSLLEDRSGSAFSGKYKSLFLGNQGSKEERLRALTDAVLEVFASIFGPDPTEYRAERGLLDENEEMGVLIQEVVGKQVGKYFLPAWSGVAFSNNEFRWSARIERSDGLARLVPGLGTRAVDRTADDYPVLIAPGRPSLRASVTLEETLRYSPKRLDAINLETNAFETLDAIELVRAHGDQYPQVRQLVSFLSADRIEQPIGPLSQYADAQPVFTFEGVIRKTPFVACLRELLAVLQKALRTPVDIEFAHDGTDFYLLQCRPQSYGGDAVPAAIPANIPVERLLFSARRFVSSGRVADLSHVVYVDLENYSLLPDRESMRAVGRAVSRLNKLLPRRRFLLIGPGRWGSRGDIKLGVPVTYSDINNAAMLIEVARQRGNYVPELSFGTHFFQDLVEASIRYLPLYPDEPQTVFREEFFRGAPNLLPELLPEYARLSETLRVIDVHAATGALLQVLMNADAEQAVGFLAAATGRAPEEKEA